MIKNNDNFRIEPEIAIKINNSRELITVLNYFTNNDYHWKHNMRVTGEDLDRALKKGDFYIGVCSSSEIDYGTKLYFRYPGYSFVDYAELKETFAELGCDVTRKKIVKSQTYDMKVKI